MRYFLIFDIINGRIEWTNSFLNNANLIQEVKID